MLQAYHPAWITVRIQTFNDNKLFHFQHRKYRKMKTLISMMMAFGLLLSSVSVWAEWQPETNNEMELSVAQAILKAKEKDETLSKWFDEAYAYAIYPKVGKGAIGIGGAHGKGIVIEGDKTIADTSLSQLTIGFQLGGQVYSEFIFFKDKTALDNFSMGNFEMSAQATAVALTAGASAGTNYNAGVAVFTIAEGGLMYEASIGGQKFKYKAK